jgi:protein SCO1/2
MKTTALFLLFATLALAAETPAVPAAGCCKEKPAAKKDACCEEKPAPKPDACCAAMETATFSKSSIYQSDVSFTDDTGKTVTLGSLRGRPVVLDMFFASCGYACPLTVTDMLAIQERLPAELRSQAVFVLVSFDTVRDTTEVLAKYRAQRGLDGQWIVLRGDDDAVRELAALLGVKYKQEADGMFSHSNVITLLNREGEIVHQRQGLKGGIDEAAAALAAAGK